MKKEKQHKFKIPCPEGALPEEKYLNSPERVFTIMAEFVKGHEFVSQIKNDVTIFGSARLSPKHKFYKEAVKLGELLGKKGFSVVTGGGGGIMEAANKGAFLAGAKSVGINVQLPFEQRLNFYTNKSMEFHYFFTRKTMLSSSVKASVFFPGGFGTFDEFLEIVVLVSKGIKKELPLICVGKDFWEPIYNIFKNVLYKNKTIEKSDLDLIHIVDNAEEACKLIIKLNKKRKTGLVKKVF